MDILQSSEYLNINDVYYVWSLGLLARLSKLLKEENSKLKKALQNGQILSLLPPGSPEQFASFNPILQRVSSAKYIVSGNYIIRSANAEQIMRLGLQWFDEERRREISTWVRLTQPDANRLEPVTGGYLFADQYRRYFLPTAIVSPHRNGVRK